MTSLAYGFSHAGADPSKAPRFRQPFRNQFNMYGSFCSYQLDYQLGLLLTALRIMKLHIAVQEYSFQFVWFVNLSPLELTHIRTTCFKRSEID